MAQRRYIQDMRQRLGLGPDDTSRDDEIEKMTFTEPTDASN